MRVLARFAIAVLCTSLVPACIYAQDATQPAAAAPAPAKKAKAVDVPIAGDPASALFDGKVRTDAADKTTVAYMPVLFYSSHASNLIQLKNGDLLCVWFSGEWEGSSGVGIVFSRLAKGSQVWTKPQLIDQQDGVSFQNPVFFQSPDGVLHLYHTTQGAHEGEANAHVLECVSKDNGATWSKPALLFDKPGAFSRHPVMVLPNGTWLLPMTYVTSKGISKGSETNYSVMELSQDSGKTWKECMVDDSFALVQPTVVQLAPDSLLSFFRSRKSDSIYQSTSKDGCTWTKPVATDLPNNNASVQSFRLKDGHIVIIFDNQHKGPRRPVSIALSEDEGKTWSYVRDVEVGRPELGPPEADGRGPSREEYSYPSVLQTSDGMIHVSYTFRRETIKTVSFNEDWIRNGSTTGLYKGTAAGK